MRRGRPPRRLDTFAHAAHARTQVPRAAVPCFAGQRHDDGDHRQPVSRHRGCSQWHVRGLTCRSHHSDVPAVDPPSRAAPSDLGLEGLHLADARRYRVSPLSIILLLDGPRRASARAPKVPAVAATPTRRERRRSTTRSLHEFSVSEWTEVFRGAPGLKHLLLGGDKVVNDMISAVCSSLKHLEELKVVSVDRGSSQAPRIKILRFGNRRASAGQSPEIPSISPSRGR